MEMSEFEKKYTEMTKRHEAEKTKLLAPHIEEFAFFKKGEVAKDHFGGFAKICDITVCDTFFEIMYCGLVVDRNGIQIGNEPDFVRFYQAETKQEMIP